MEIKKEYIRLKDLQIYQLARNLSRTGWNIYQRLDWQTRKITGDQFIESTDSIGANIAEGYQRYHYLDKIKFYYNARASLSEANDHWIELLKERGKVNNEEDYLIFKESAKKLSVKLNNYIRAIYQAKSKPQ